MKPTNRTVYYLPGHGGRIDTGLGEGLRDRGCSVVGRETISEFRELPFQSQIDVVADDLKSLFWHEDSYVVAMSFGAYLFLHAQAKLEPYIGNVLLLSPIVGAFSDEGMGLGFIPPRAHRLRQLADQNLLPAPVNCQIHVGSEDWQSRPEDVVALAKKLHVPVTVVQGAGHMLGKEYVGALLDQWLT